MFLEECSYISKNKMRDIDDDLEISSDESDEDVSGEEQIVA